MRLITLTTRVMDLIRCASLTGSFTDMPRKAGPDAWEIAVDDDTLAEIQSLALSGESISDTIERIAALRNGRSQ